MRFKILGPLEISDDDFAPVAVTRRLHRLAIATMLLNAGRPCAPGDLISALWGDDPPLSPDVSLRSCVYGIRKLLPDPARLQTHPAGYLIVVRPGELDVHSFRDLAGQGREALDAGDAAAAAGLIGSALELWREPALADLPAGPGRARLLDQRMQCQDALIDARLALGCHRQVLPELRESVAADPLREHAWAQLITALYRCGARAEALAAFGRLRMTLVTAYGIEPGPELQDLHRRVLADDPVLLSRAGAVLAAGHPPWQPPCQLPASVADFTGRTAELDAILDRLSGDAMTVTVVTGMLGTGKTALAVHAAHLCRPAFPDGQLYACLDDDGTPRDPQLVLGELLRGIGVPDDQIPAPGFEREALYRSALAGRRVLVLADGARTAAQVRPLLPGTAGSAVLVTSRTRLADLDSAKIVEVGAMRPAEAARLVETISGRTSAPSAGPAGDPAALAGDLVRAGETAGDPAAMAVASACGYLPLALRIAGARLAEDPGLTMIDLARLLADESRLLDQLVVGEVSARARLAAAVQSAGSSASRALAVFAAARGPDARGPVIAALPTGTGANAAAPALADAGLLHRVGGSRPNGARYLVHPLARAYAGELLVGAGSTGGSAGSAGTAAAAGPASTPSTAGPAPGRPASAGRTDPSGRGDPGRPLSSRRITTLVGDRRVTSANPARS